MGQFSGPRRRRCYAARLGFQSNNFADARLAVQLRHHLDAPRHPEIGEAGGEHLFEPVDLFTS